MNNLTLLRNYGLSGVHCPWRVETDAGRTVAMFRDKDDAERFLPSARPRPPAGVVLADNERCAITLTARQWCTLERLAHDAGELEIAREIDQYLASLEEVITDTGGNGNNGRDH